MTMIAPDFSAETTTAQSRQVAEVITSPLCHHARELIAVALEAEVQTVMK